MDLREYEQIKFQLAELLRSSGASSSQLPREIQDRVRELFTRLAEDRFNLVAVGTVNGVGGTPLASQSRPCGICGHVIDRCFEFLRHFQYDITVNSERQQQLAERGGLCSFHSWIYEQVASPQGTCTGYASVVPDSGPCLVCDARTAAESAAVTAIAGRLRQNPEPTLASLSELCLPHLRLLAANLGDGPITAQLPARHGAILQRMAEDMRRYALKHDGLRRYLASDEESKAADRALMVLAGHRTLNTPPPRR